MLAPLLGASLLANAIGRAIVLWRDVKRAGEETIMIFNAASCFN